MKKFKMGARVKVHRVDLPGTENMVIVLDPPREGTVVRLLRRDESAWVTLDERVDHDVHPFPEEDVRGRNVLAWPDDCAEVRRRTAQPEGEER